MMAQSIVLIIVKMSTSAENYIGTFLVLLLVVPVPVGMIRGIGSEVGGVEGSLINAIANILSPEISLISLAFGALSYFAAKMV